VSSVVFRRGEITIGNVSTFLLYIVQLLMNFMILSAVLGSVMAVVGASHKIVKIIEYKPKIKTTGGVKFSKEMLNGEISLNDVSFAYPSKKDVDVLKNINIDITKNKVIALVGASGCGKSSIISMIERYYDPIKG
jgi:ABC-type multidrug transport system fused ATPase/permease subunit